MWTALKHRSANLEIRMKMIVEIQAMDALTDKSDYPKRDQLHTEISRR